MLILNTTYRVKPRHARGRLADDMLRVTGWHDFS